MERLSPYLAPDRCNALFAGRALPERTEGTALFADISGFTPLAELLTTALGPLRGPEELTVILNRVYDAVIAEVDYYGGAVIGFSGDAVTCWFDGDDGLVALRAALQIQQAMQGFRTVDLPGGRSGELSIKIGVACGAARRFVVGDPAIQRLDVLAGHTLTRMAGAQLLARRGEILLDAADAERLSGVIEVGEWRRGKPGESSAAVIAGLDASVPPLPPIQRPPNRSTFDEAILHSWVLPAVLARIRAQRGEFLTEMRPALPVFGCFEGIDYDADDLAGSKLDAYVRWIQHTVSAYEGSLIDIGMGDKGSTFYVAFGAPIAHENDGWRAMTTALTLLHPPQELSFVSATRIGIASGTMRTGAYGGTTRRTYGVLGDDVNLAARLMQLAQPGQIQVSQRARRAAGDGFIFEELVPVPVKGKDRPIERFALKGVAVKTAIRLHEPQYSLPMVGRTSELDEINQRLDHARQGRGQTLRIVAEAGLGKSRLVAEAIRLAFQKGFSGYGGQCQSYGTHSSYLAWVPVWQGLFGLEPADSPAANLHRLSATVQDIDPNLLPRLPLLSAVCGVPIPDTDLTASFDAKLRKASLEALLVDCLRAMGSKNLLLIVLEDVHWIDPQSRDLLHLIARTIADLPVVLLIAARPPPPGEPDDAPESSPRHGHTFRLGHFTAAESELLITLKLRQLFGAEASIPQPLIERFVTLAEGNPFYLEELLNYLQDRKIALDNLPALERLELPSSLHSLILSRFDQLSEHQRSTLKIASVVGRIFRAASLWGAYPELGLPEAVLQDLERLHRLEMTVLESADPELIYIFKHIVTQEVAYQSLPAAVRATLHSSVGRHFEQLFATALDNHLDLLAYHYDRSDDADKRRDYLLRAGIAAQGRYANSAAADYFQRVLPTVADHLRIDTLLRLGQVQELLGQWIRAGETYQSALQSSLATADIAAEARCRTAIGELLRKQARYPEALEALQQARNLFEQLHDEAGVGQVLHFSGTIAAQQGDHNTARQRYDESLAIRRRLGQSAPAASLFSNLAILAHQYRGDLATARQLHEESLALRRSLGDRWAIGNSLNNLAMLLKDAGDYPHARKLAEESVALYRQVGDRWCLANSLSTLAEVTLEQRDFASTRTSLDESLAINRDLAEPRAIAFILEFFARLSALENQPERALTLLAATTTLRAAIGAPLSPAEAENQQRLVQSLADRLDPARAQRATRHGTSLSTEEAIAFATTH